MNLHEAIAQILNPVLGDAVDDVTFGLLVDDAVDDLADRFAAVGS